MLGEEWDAAARLARLGVDRADFYITTGSRR